MGEIESRSSRFCGGGGIEERGYFWPKSREQLANRKSKRKVIAAGCRLSQLALSPSLHPRLSPPPSLPLLRRTLTYENALVACQNRCRSLTSDSDHARSSSAPLPTHKIITRENPLDSLISLSFFGGKFSPYPPGPVSERACMGQ